LSTIEATFAMLNVPKNSRHYLQFGLLWYGRFFGYEKEHEISMQMGEDTLFPKLEQLIDPTIAAAEPVVATRFLTEPAEKHCIQ
jgi:hypothetical protein